MKGTSLHKAWTRLICLPFFLCLVWNAVLSESIRVSHSSDAQDSHECWLEEGPPCKTLGYALQGVLSGSTVHLEAGSFDLEGHNILNGVDSVTITGDAEAGGSTIQCDFDKPGGLKFELCTKLSIKGPLEMVNCGILQNTTCIFGNPNETVPSPSAIFFHNCTDVTITNLTVRDSNGTGLTMYSVIGEVVVSGSQFIGNRIVDASQWVSGGTGLYIEFPSCPPGASKHQCTNPDNSDARYTIDSCYFERNNGSVTDVYTHALSVENGTSHVSFGRGGALSVYFGGKATGNVVSVRSSNFTRNTAVWGGGLFVQFQDKAQDNVFTCDTCQISENALFYDVVKKTGTGGGGARIGFVFYEGSPVVNNTMLFNNSVFRANRAYWGGGVSYVVPKENSINATNRLTFKACFFIENTARLGSAIDLDSYHPIIVGSLAPVVFEGCSFFSNSYNYYIDNNQLLAWQYLLGRGTVYTNSIPLKFVTTNTFWNNTGTGLASFNAPIYFEDGSDTGFMRNKGEEGGAVALIGDAVMILGENVTINFENNWAERLGGALYAVNLGGHQLVASRNCFLRYFDSLVHPSKWKVKFTFVNNTAEVSGDAIYTTSLLPCLWGVDGDSLNTSLDAHQEAFRWSPAFQYNSCPTDNFTQEWECSKTQIASDLSDVRYMNIENALIVNSSSPGEDNSSTVIVVREPIVKFAPGNFTPLPFDLKDDLENHVNTVFYARVTCGPNFGYDNESCNPGVSVDEITTYVSSLTIALDGVPNGLVGPDEAHLLPVLTLNSVGSMEYQLCVRVNLTCCPPGFFQRDNKCECGDQSSSLSTIVSCNTHEYVAYLKSNHWVGYYNESGGYNCTTVCKNRTLYSAICPPQYCKMSTRANGNFSKYASIRLNVEASNDQLSELLCANRTGELCGDCLDGYSVAINEIGNGASCIRCRDAYIGTNIAWLVWLATEIVPITLLVVLFLIFDFKILKGPLNAFMLYAQVLEFFGLHANGELNSVWLQGTKWDYLTRLYRYLFGFWNLQFLSSFLDDFCLAENVNRTFHVYLIKYAIALYPFFLLTVFYLCRACISRIPVCNRAIIRIQHVFIRWQRLWKTRSNIVNGLTALMVLSYSKITAISFTILATTTVEHGSEIISVVRFQGTMRPFEGEHVPYAILAMFFILTIILIPPIILIVHPFLPLLYEKFKLNRFKAFVRLNKLSNRFLVNGFLPPFQGCYTNRMEFFAGIMFIARILFLAAFASGISVGTLFCYNTVISLVLLILHSSCQPYKERWVNVLDTVIYSIMVVINVLSLYNLYSFGKDGHVEESAFYVQLLLIYCPLLYLAGWVLFSISSACCKCYRSGKEYKRVNSFTKQPRRVLSKESIIDSSIRSTPRSSGMGQHLVRDELLDYDMESSGSFWERERLVQSRSKLSRSTYNSINEADEQGGSVSESVMAIRD